MTIYGNRSGLETDQVCEALETLATQMRKGKFENLELGRSILMSFNPNEGMSWFRYEKHEPSPRFPIELPLVKGPTREETYSYFIHLDKNGNEV